MDISARKDRSLQEIQELLQDLPAAFSDINTLCKDYMKLRCNVYNQQELIDALWRIPIRDLETPPGSFSNDPMRATREISGRRYSKFFSFMIALQALKILGDSFLDRERKSIGPTAVIWLKRLGWLSVMLFFGVDYALARISPIARFQWWIKKQYSSIHTRVFSGEDREQTLQALNKHMGAEWNNIIFNTPETYLYTMQMSYPMSLFMTEQGYIGLGPATLEAGDIVSILFGSKAPLILRPRSEGHGYYVVGEAYVYGAMHDGEYLKKSDREDEEFVLF
jgi:hypothetical protein